MEPREVIDDFKAALAEVKAEGKETVSIAALEKYLDELRADAGKSNELRKLEYQGALAHYDARNKHRIEMFKSVLDAGREALNSLVLINGGAVVALLGFMGATISKGLSQTLGASLTVPLIQFGMAVLMGSLGFGARYFSQAAYSSEINKLGVVFNVVAVGFALFGYILFGLGIYGAYQAFSSEFAL